MKRFLHSLILSLLLGSLNSCQVYRAQFDCPPGIGVPCTSVTDIEKMIIETPDGSPDIFLSYLPSSKPQCVKIGTAHALERKVWIAEKVDPRGRVIAGHYIYLSKMGAEPCQDAGFCPRSSP